MHPNNYVRTYTVKQLEAIARTQIQNLKKSGLFSGLLTHEKHLVSLYMKLTRRFAHLTV
jgi:hypothetical protein